MNPKKFQAQNAIIGLVMLYLDHGRYLEMAYEHSIANDIKSSNKVMEDYKRGFYPIPHMRDKIMQHLTERGAELKLLIKYSLWVSFLILTFTLIFSYFLGIIDPNLPIDKKKFLFSITYCFVVIATMVSLLNGPQSMDGNTLPEIAHLQLKVGLYSIGAICGFIGLLVN